MKTNEELDALRNEIEDMNRRLQELTSEELKQVTGGFIPPYPPIRKVGHSKRVGSDPEGWEDPRYILGGKNDPAQ